MQATTEMIQREARQRLIEARDALTICIDMLGVSHKVPLTSLFAEHEKFIDYHEKAVKLINELIVENNGESQTEDNA